MAKKYMEDAHIQIRNMRRTFLEGVKKETISEDQMNGIKKEVQKCTDDFNQKIEILFENKKKEICPS